MQGHLILFIYRFTTTKSSSSDTWKKESVKKEYLNFFYQPFFTP